MRSLVTALIIAALLILGSEIYMVRLENTSEELSEINTEVFEAINNDDYETALGHIDELSEKMDSAEMFFGAMGNHEETDKINMSIAELRGYAEEERRADAAAKCRVLRFLFGHLPENSRLKIENIL